jgi:hypothetical protein
MAGAPRSARCSNTARWICCSGLLRLMVLFMRFSYASHGVLRLWRLSRSLSCYVALPVLWSARSPQRDTLGARCASSWRCQAHSASLSGTAGLVVPLIF